MVTGKPSMFPVRGIPLSDEVVGPRLENGGVPRPDERIGRTGGIVVVGRARDENWQQDHQGARRGAADVSQGTHADPLVA
jgi:hypothetical protein